MDVWDVWLRDVWMDVRMYGCVEYYGVSINKWIN
jgi:hypothetical protein